MAGLEAALATGGGQPVSSAQLSPALQAVEAAARAQASDELIPAQHMPDLHKVGTLPPHPTHRPVRPQLGYISTISRRYLDYISGISRLHLDYISTTSPQVERAAGEACALELGAGRYSRDIAGI